MLSRRYVLFWFLSECLLVTSLYLCRLKWIFKIYVIPRELKLLASQVLAKKCFALLRCPKQITPAKCNPRRGCKSWRHCCAISASDPGSFSPLASHVHNQCTQVLHKRRSGEQNPVMFKCHQGWPQLSAITNPVSSWVESETGTGGKGWNPPIPIFLLCSWRQETCCCGSVLYLLPTYMTAISGPPFLPLSLVLSACGLRLQLELQLLIFRDPFSHGHMA